MGGPFIPGGMPGLVNVGVALGVTCPGGVVLGAAPSKRDKLILSDFRICVCVCVS